MTNPITARLTARGGYPSPRTLVWVTGGLLVVTLALGWAVWGSTLPPAAYSALLDLSTVTGIALSLMVAPAAAVITTQAGSPDLLRVTPLRAARIVEGYLLGAAYRLRMPLALGVMALHPVILHVGNSRPYGGSRLPLPFLGVPADVWLIEHTITEVTTRLLWLTFPLLLGVAVALNSHRTPHVMAGGSVLVLLGVTFFTERAIMGLLLTTIPVSRSLSSYIFARWLAHDMLSTALGSLLPLATLTWAAWRAAVQAVDQ